MFTARTWFQPARSRLGLAVAVGTLVTSALAGMAVVSLSAARTPRTALAAQQAPAQVTESAAASSATIAYVYLTFDDGPHPTYTPQVLDVLRRNGIRATFFQIGREVYRYGPLTTSAYQRGHSVQNHTWSHVDLRRQSWTGFRQQIVDTDRFIRARTGVTPRCLRPPYGATDALVRLRAASLGKTIKLWSVDPRDWQRPGAWVIANRVLSQVRPGSVILLHDGGGNRSQTVAALWTIIRNLKARGYSFATMCR